MSRRRACHRPSKSAAIRSTHKKAYSEPDALRAEALRMVGDSGEVERPAELHHVRRMAPRIERGETERLALRKAVGLTWGSNRVEYDGVDRVRGVKVVSPK